MMRFPLIFTNKLDLIQATSHINTALKRYTFKLNYNELLGSAIFVHHNRVILCT